MIGKTSRAPLLRRRLVRAAAAVATLLFRFLNSGMFLQPAG